MEQTCSRPETETPLKYFLTFSSLIPEGRWGDVEDALIKKRHLCQPLSRKFFCILVSTTLYIHVCVDRNYFLPTHAGNRGILGKQADPFAWRFEAHPEMTLYTIPVSLSPRVRTQALGWEIQSYFIKKKKKEKEICWI